MLPGKRRLIAGLAGVVAAVLFVDVDPMKWYHEQSAVYSVDKNDLFNYITSPGDVKDVSQDADKLVHSKPLNGSSDSGSIYERGVLALILGPKFNFSSHSGSRRLKVCLPSTRLR